MEAEVQENMHKHADALGAAVPQLEPLLDPHARRASSHVARVSIPQSAQERRVAFEDIISKAEAVIRQARIQQGEKKQTDEMPVLMPLLEKLPATIEVETEHQNRGLKPLEGIRANSDRMNIVDDLRRIVRNYADRLRATVTPDRLWNAYCMDFRGRNKEWLTTQEWQQNEFVKHMPETMAALRRIVVIRAMQKLARKIKDNADDSEEVIPAVNKFMTKLGPNYTFSAEITSTLELLSADNITTEERSSALSKLVNTLETNAQKLEMALKKPDEYQRYLTGIVRAFEHDKANFMQQFQAGEAEQIDLFDHPKARAKRDAEIEAMKEKGFAQVLDCAPHLRDKISAIRAEAALRTIDNVLEPNWRAVSDLYPYQGLGQGTGSGAEKPPKGGRDGRG